VVRGRPGGAAVRDAWRLALGTLTIVPVRPPTRVDRRTAGRAMVLAPLVGLLLAVAGVALLWACRGLPPLVTSTLVVALLAVLTRGMHLDGLADTADGLGAARSADQSLAVMRKGDVGPFGVVTLVLALLLQVTALGTLVSRGDGAYPLVVALVVSRLALPLVCSRGVPAARSDGLGSLVAGSVSRPALLGAAALAAVALLLLARVPTGALEDSAGSSGAMLVATSTTAADVLGPVVWGIVPLVVAGLLVWRCVARLGGVTGDVLGASVEVAFTTALLVACR
jgi:adenosylcobinamide-GDP ribazoletransferase